ncbi:MAG: oligopeptide transporter, OPT family, partial [Bdellovibrionales bacterium]|nr:oligopeptide transporter, OPT family [Bdellovibrionales bacterium]
MRELSPSKQHREATPRAILLGLAGAVVMLAANAYLALMAGMTINASMTAAVLALALLRGVLKNGSVHECNLVQTMTSTGESLAAGAIFTIPAFVLVGAWSGFDYWKTTLIVGSGGVLGVLAMIPLRRPFIASPHSVLRYPEGTACATVLQAADSRPGALRLLGFSGLAGGCTKLLEQLHLMAPSLDFGARIGSGVVAIGTAVSPALVGVGYIIGLPIAALVFIGGAIEWLVAIPLLTPDNLDPQIPATVHASNVWAAKGRFLGVGAMVIGGIEAIWAVRRALVEALFQIGRSAHSVPNRRREDEELSMSVWRRSMAVSVAVVLRTYIWLLDGFW